MYTKVEEVSYKALDGRKYLTTEIATAASVLFLTGAPIAVDQMAALLKKLTTHKDLVKWLRESLPTDRMSVLEERLAQIRAAQEVPTTEIMFPATYNYHVLAEKALVAVTGSCNPAQIQRAATTLKKELASYVIPAIVKQKDAGTHVYEKLCAAADELVKDYKGKGYYKAEGLAFQEAVFNAGYKLVKA